MLVDAYAPISLARQSAGTRAVGAADVAVPVGLYLISPLKRPISSSSVHGSLSSCSSVLSSASPAGVGDLAGLGGVGEGCAAFARFLGGIVAADDQTRLTRAWYGMVQRGAVDGQRHLRSRLTCIRSFCLRHAGLLAGLRSDSSSSLTSSSSFLASTLNSHQI